MSAYRDHDGPTAYHEQLRAAELAERQARAAVEQARATLLYEVARGLAITNNLDRLGDLSSDGYAKRVDALHRLFARIKS